MSHDPIELRADNLDFAFGSHHVLSEITMSVRTGERLGIVGESGSGKTTLARLLVGALASDAVTANDRPWKRIDQRASVRRRVQMIFQDPYASLTSRVTVGSAVREAAMVCRGLSRRKAQTVADELLAAVGLGEALRSRRPRQLSGGQCQRVSIARALAADPAVIIADEPTSALDLSVQAQIINLLLELAAETGIGLVLISHDLAVVRHLTDRILIMQAGRIIEQGATQEVMANPQYPYTQRLCRAASYAIERER